MKKHELYTKVNKENLKALYARREKLNTMSITHLARNGTVSDTYTEADRLSELRYLNCKEKYIKSLIREE